MLCIMSFAIHPLGFLLNLSMGKASSATSNINYHIVWCPEYRKLILTGKSTISYVIAPHKRYFKLGLVTEDAIYLS
jgi:hypothetical protein